MIGLQQRGKSQAYENTGQGFSSLSTGGSAEVHPEELWPHFATDPRFGNLGGQLLLTLVREVAAQKRAESHAWIHAFSTTHETESAQWSRYLSHVETRLRRGPVDLAALAGLLDQAPSTSGTPLLQFRDILTETDSAIFASDILSLARLEQNRGRFPAFTQGLLEVASLHSTTAERATQLLRIRAGGGSWAEQLEYQSDPLMRELLSPLALASFGSAVLASRFATLSVLSRAQSFRPATLILSEAAGLGVEVPTLVLTRRLGLQAFVGGDHLFAADSLGHDLAATFAPFAFLRVAGNAFSLAAPTLRQVQGFQSATGELTLAGRSALGTARLSTEISAVLGGHLFNGALDLEPHFESGSQLLLSSLLTVGHMRIAGRVVEGLSPMGLSQALTLQHARLRTQTIEDLLNPVGLTPEHSLRPRIDEEIHGALREGTVSPLRLSRWVSLNRQGRNPEVASQMEARGLHLLSLYYSQGNAPRDFGDWGFGLQPVGANGRVLRPDSSRGSNTFNLGGRLEPIRMVQDNGTGMNGRKGGSSEPPPSSETGREQTLRAEIGSRSERLAEEAAKANAPSKVQRAAERLSDLLGRYVEDPEETLTVLNKELEEVGTDLTSANKSTSRIKNMVQELRLYVEQMRSLRQSQKSAKGKSPSDSEPDPLLVPNEPQGFFAQRVLNPLGRLYVGVRDSIKRLIDRDSSEEMVQSEKNSTEASETSENSSDALDFDAIAQVLDEKAEQGKEISKAARTLENLKNLLSLASQTDVLSDENWQASVGELIHNLRRMFPNLSWRNIPSSVRVEMRREGTLLGLAVRPDWLTQDSALARRLRPAGESPPISRELSSLHDGILLAAHYRGQNEGFQEHLNRLVTEYGLIGSEAAAVQLSSETTYRLIRGEVNPEGLVSFLQGQTKDGPLENRLQTLERALDPELDPQRALEQLGTQAHEADYLFTGLWVLLRAYGGEVPFNELLISTRQGQPVGFHPSMAISLFGAAEGRNRLPREWFFEGLELDDYLTRTQEEFDKND